MSSLDQVWAAFDKIRSERNRFAHARSLPSEANNKENAGDLVSLLQKHFVAKDGFYSFHGLEHLSPKDIAEFCASLIERFQPKTVLDPTCGYGIFLAAAAQLSSLEALHGVDVNLQATQVASVVGGGKSTIIHGDIFAEPPGLLDCYDLIISDPPLNVRIREEKRSSGWTPFKTLDLAANLMIWASSRLSDAVVPFLSLHPHSSTHQIGVSSRRLLQLMDVDLQQPSIYQEEQGATPQSRHTLSSWSVVSKVKYLLGVLGLIHHLEIIY